MEAPPQTIDSFLKHILLYIFQVCDNFSKIHIMFINLKARGGVFKGYLANIIVIISTPTYKMILFILVLIYTMMIILIILTILLTCTAGFGVVHVAEMIEDENCLKM